MKKSLFSLMLFAFCWIAPTSLVMSQNITTTNSVFEVKRGERPPILLQAIPPDSYKTGILLIKFKAIYADKIESAKGSTNDNGLKLFNLQAVDELNAKNNAIRADTYFSIPGIKSGFSERHMAWGFHLWYKIEFSPNADVISLVNLYKDLEEIETAEPEYKIQLIESIAAPSGHNPSQSGQITSPEWTPDDPYFDVQWNYNNTGQLNGTPDADIDMIEAWDIEKGSTDVIVAIIDGGIQFNHPDIAGNMWSGIGYNFVNNSSDIVPEDHGTHVAGIVGAISNNSIGVAGVAGGSGSGDGVRLMSCQVFTPNSNGGFHLAPIWAADNGASISQNSYSYSSPNVYNQSLLDAIDYFNANGGGNALSGGITIFAAGNFNSSDNYYPGCYSGTLAVAATNDKDMKAYYSNYGTWVDISAPGGGGDTFILSTWASSNYGSYEGTSMACPHVSGVAALVISLAFNEMTSFDLNNILISTTDDHYASNPDYIGMLGSGRLNAYQALLRTQNLLTGVLKPMSFTATGQDTSSVLLNWEKNVQNNNVMVSWAPSNTFGTPEPGIFYTVGDVLPGGGEVVYSGDGLEFVHQGLDVVTTYYYKAWSYNSEHLYSFGIKDSATTLNYPPVIMNCGDLLTDIRDGQQYETVLIGNQCWTKENLNYIMDNSYCYDYQQANCETYGRLYSWQEAVSACPSGWHLPSDDEWTILTNFLGGTDVAGGKMKSTSGWAGNGNGTNESGFTGLPGGGTGGYNGAFIGIGDFGLWWSATTELNTQFAWFRYLSTYNGNTINRQTTYKIIDLSVRCVRIEESQTNLPTVNTTAVTVIETTSATSGGNVVNDGGSPVTTRGVVWSTFETPTINANDGITSNGTGTGEFVSNLTSLTPNQPYFLRAYATNNKGTAYGNEISFSTLSSHLINLPQGWSGISSYLIPTDSDVESILQPIISDLTILQSGTGIYWPGQNINTIGSWDTHQGYVIKVANAVDLTITGLRENDRTLYLSEGWNLIPVLSNYEVDVETLFNGTNLVILKEVAGVGIYWPLMNIQSLNFVGPGKAYFIKMSSPDSITFPVKLLVVTPQNPEVTAVASELTIEITSNTSWSVIENVAWLSVSPVSGSNNGTFTVTYEANSSSESRIGQITIIATGGTLVVSVTVTQAGVSWACGQTLNDTRDSKTYATIQIGSQCWMAQNLNIGSRIAGSSNQTNNPTIEKYCYSNSDAQCDVYGGLYQWNEMMSYTTTPGVQGICPDGWHLPTDAEWTALTIFLGFESVAGGKMKETGTTHWSSPNTGATNSSGFTGLPGGIRDTDGTFNVIGNFGYFWSSTQLSSSNAWFRYLHYNYAFVNRNASAWGYGFSVRCVRD